MTSGAEGEQKQASPKVSVTSLTGLIMIAHDGHTQTGANRNHAMHMLDNSAKRLVGAAKSIKTLGAKGSFVTMNVKSHPNEPEELFVFSPNRQFPVFWCPVHLFVPYFCLMVCNHQLADGDAANSGRVPVKRLQFTTTTADDGGTGVYLDLEPAYLSFYGAFTLMPKIYNIPVAFSGGNTLCAYAVLPLFFAVLKSLCSSHGKVWPCLTRPFCSRIP